MASANGVSYSRIPGLRMKVNKVWARLQGMADLPRICHCSGTPTDSAGDYADRDGDYCIDIDSDDVFVASGVTRGSATTWTKKIG